MPPRLERRQQTGNLHLITFSCYQRKPYLATPKAACIFENSLEAIRQKYLFHIYAYVVMPEHIHLVVSEPPTHPLSTVLGALKRSVSKQLLRLHFGYPAITISTSSHTGSASRKPVTFTVTLWPEVSPRVPPNIPGPASTPTQPTSKVPSLLLFPTNLRSRRTQASRQTPAVRPHPA